jgi:hypothetical protein
MEGKSRKCLNLMFFRKDRGIFRFASMSQIGEFKMSIENLFDIP